MTREFLDAIFLYPFKQLKLQRMTALVPAGREDLIRFYSLFGFREEGRLREALPDDDIILMGLLARDYGQEERAAASA